MGMLSDLKLSTPICLFRTMYAFVVLVILLDYYEPLLLYEYYIYDVKYKSI
jgi:hypothetical protein